MEARFLLRVYARCAERSFSRSEQRDVGQLPTRVMCATALSDRADRLMRGNWLQGVSKMNHSSFKRLAIYLTISAVPAVALCQTTPTPSNQTGNNTPGQVLNNNNGNYPNGGTTGTYNGPSPTGNSGNAAGTYNGAKQNHAGYKKALHACKKMPADQQSDCRDQAAKQYAATAKAPRLSEECDQLSGTQRSDCLKSQNGGGK